VRVLMRRIAVVSGLLPGLCPGGVARVAMALPRVDANVAHVAGKTAPAISLGQNVSAAVFDPTPAREAPDGRLFVAVQGPFDDVNNPRGVGEVRALDARNGRVLRSIPVGYAPDSLALDPSGRRLFVANRIDRTVDIVDSRTGARLRTAVVPPTPLQMVTDASTGRVVLASGGVSDSAGTPLGSGGVSLLDARNGRLLSTTPVAGISQGLSIDHRRGRAYVLADAVGVVNLKSGDLTGRIPIQGNGVSVAEDEGIDRVFVLTSRQVNPAAPVASDLSTLDASSGRPLDVATLQGDAASLAVDTAAHRVLVFANDYPAMGMRVDVVDAHTGKLLHIARPAGLMNLSSSAAPVVDTRHGRAFVGVSSPTSAEVGVWSTRTGMLSRTITVAGSYVQAMAVDERSGRLYVIGAAQGPNPCGYLTIIDPLP